MFPFLSLLPELLFLLRDIKKSATKTKMAMGIKGTSFFPANGEWQANGNDPAFERARLELAESIQYKHPDYYVAICPCYREALEFSGQDEKNSKGFTLEYDTYNCFRTLKFTCT